jgi:Rrf2 family protein
MMLTRTSEYALQAVICLARCGNPGPVSGKRIAIQTGIPGRYLSKILADLVRAGVLIAAPGKTGGFRLARLPKDIRLAEVLGPFEPVLANRRPCPFGAAVCNDDQACAGHDRWMRVRETYSRFLNETTVDDVAGKRDPCFEA